MSISRNFSRSRRRRRKIQRPPGILMRLEVLPSSFCEEAEGVEEVEEGVEGRFVWVGRTRRDKGDSLSCQIN